MGEVAKSAYQAIDMGFLRPNASVIMNKHELLHAASAKIDAMVAANYRPQMRQPIRVAGKQGIARLQTQLVNLQAGEMISAHDYFVASKIATVLCGGEIETGSLVDEAWILKLERDVFVELASTEKTLARITHMLETGKPLRN